MRRVCAAALLPLLCGVFVMITPKSAEAQTLLVPTTDACGNNSSAVVANGGYPITDSTLEQVQSHLDWAAAQIPSAATNRQPCTTYLDLSCIMAMGTTSTDNSKLHYMVRCLAPEVAAPLVDSDTWSVYGGQVLYSTSSNPTGVSYTFTAQDTFVAKGLDIAFGVTDDGWSNAGAAVDAARTLCMVSLDYYPSRDGYPLADQAKFFTIKYRSANPLCTGSGSPISKQKGTCCFSPEFGPEDVPDWYKFTGCDNFTVKSDDVSEDLFIEGDTVPVTLTYRTAPPPDTQQVNVYAYSDGTNFDSSQKWVWTWSGTDISFELEVPPKEGVGASTPRKLDYVQFLARCADGTSGVWRFDPTGAGGSASTGSGADAADRLRACLDEVSIPTNPLYVGDGVIAAMRCLAEWLLVPSQPLSYWTSYASALTRGSGGESVVEFARVPFEALSTVANSTTSQTSYTFKGNTVTLPQPPASLATLLRGAMTFFLLLAVVMRVQRWLARALKLHPMDEGTES